MFPLPAVGGGPDTEGARVASSLGTRVLVLLIYGSFVLQ